MHLEPVAALFLPANALAALSGPERESGHVVLLDVRLDVLVPLSSRYPAAHQSIPPGFLCLHLGPSVVPRR